MSQANAVGPTTIEGSFSSLILRQLIMIIRQLAQRMQCSFLHGQLEKQERMEVQWMISLAGGVRTHIQPLKILHLS